MDFECYAASKSYTNAEAQEIIAALSGGLKYRGAVNYYSDLPVSPEIGDAYTIKYKGSSGTVIDGSEYGWGTYEGTAQWIPIGPDIKSKLTEPSSMSVGQYFKIASIDADGHAVLEAVSYIPYTDLSSGVQASLDLADTALQSHQSLAAYRTSAQQDVIDNGKMDKPVTENYTVATSAWTALASSSPFTYSTTVTATHTIGSNTNCRLINNNAVLFATYGFAISSVSGQIVTVYSIGKPTASVILEVDYYG